jgi:hypothetical protein
MAQLMAGAPVASSGMWLLLRAFHAIRMMSHLPFNSGLPKQFLSY